MPTLTVRSFAELLRMPAYEQTRILHEQKYPKQAPQSFKAPYYQVALAGINAHYRSGNGSGVLISAMAKAKSLNPVSKAKHNARVLTLFQTSNQAARQLTPAARTTTKFSLGNGVDLKLTFDLCAIENGTDWGIFYNFRDVALDPDVALMTLDLASWIQSQVVPATARKLQYVDLTTGKVFTTRKPRKRTIQLANENAKLIATLWPTI